MKLPLIARGTLHFFIFCFGINACIGPRRSVLGQELFGIFNHIPHHASLESILLVFLGRTYLAVLFFLLVYACGIFRLRFHDNDSAGANCAHDLTRYSRVLRLLGSCIRLYDIPWGGHASGCLDSSLAGLGS